MDFALLAFYAFAVAAVVSAGAVISVRNPVHAALFLVLTFFTVACTWILAGAEFLGIALILVYVGAVMVLFLFVVMMLDVDFAQLREGFARYLPAGGVVGAVLLVEMVIVSAAVATHGAAAGAKPLAPSGVTNAEAIGRVLYTDYVYFFQAAGIVLLIAMIGAIVLTLHHRPHVRRQDIGRQVGRTPARGMEVVQIKSGDVVAE